MRLSSSRSLVTAKQMGEQLSLIKYNTFKNSKPDGAKIC